MQTKTLQTRIIDLLKIHGPLSATSIAKLLGENRTHVVATISRVRNRYPQTRIRVAGYTTPESDHIKLPSLYVAEAGEDAPFIPSKIIKSQAATIIEPVRYGQTRGDERIVIPALQRPFCNATTTSLYLGTELGYRGQA